jgi:hypothetical protein
VTDLEVAERKALFILLTQHRIDSSAYATVEQLNSDFDAHIADHLLEPAFKRWVDDGLAKADRRDGKFRARLRRDSFAEAYRRVLELYGASSITIYPEMHEIVSDVTPTNEFPVKDGWKWFTLESDQKAAPAAIYGHNQTLISPTPRSRFRVGPINWTKWGTILTGLGIIVGVILWKFS